jgi:hypothetical protein
MRLLLDILSEIGLCGCGHELMAKSPAIRESHGRATSLVVSMYLYAGLIKSSAFFFAF